MIKCSKCGEVSDSKFCPKCGNDLTNGESKGCNVIIHSYEEVYAANPDIKVYDKDNLITSLPKGQTFSYNVSEVTTLTFKCSIRKCSVTVDPNVTTEIRLMFNRLTGKLEAICNIQGEDASQNVMNQKAYENKVNQKKNNSLIVLIVVIVLFVLALLFL